MVKLAIFTLIFFSIIFTPAFGQTIPTTYSVPDQWGTLVSPDKSIPEFNPVFLFVTFLIGIMFTIFLTKNKFDFRFQFKN